ncbi:N-acetyl-gamma-glutamyl-phosphate reductase [Deltaproteobacteria bacterium]|nr:N-acetyl-gamma-glutamyl-phosphate reductase [Deltaproteobacteria bacterium]
MTTIRAGLVGVTGYTGMELVRLLEQHPRITLVAVTSRAEYGKPVREIYPFLQGFRAGDLVIAEPDPDYLAANCDLVFLATPHGAAMEIAARLRSKNVLVVDISADFRLHDAHVYQEWYKTEHSRTELLREAVYGLPELHAAEIAKAKLIANPGCYPTASILALAPALTNRFIETDDIVIDAKSGASGAGRKAVTGSLYCEVSDTFSAYNLTRHRHTPEIEQELSAVAGKSITLSFNTHLLPVNRGILATVYTRIAGDFASGVSPEMVQKTVREAYAKFYAPHPFVRVLPAGRLPELRFVRGTMFCDIAVVYDARIKRLIFLSAIDNLCRGASGQAIANANLMNGLDLTTGLKLVPVTP